MASFQDILAKASADIKPPEAITPGTYLCIVDGQPAFGKIGKNQTDAVDYMLKPMQPQGDVDQNALAQMLQGKALQEKKIRARYFITEDSVWRLKEFLDNCGVEEGTKSLGERIPEAMGKQILVTVGHKASEDGKQIFSEIKSTAKV